MKLHKALKGSEYDLASLRLILQENDDSDHGVIQRKKMRSIFVDHRLPLPGPLLNTLIKRCDDEKDGMINWANCVNLLDQAMKFDPKAYEKQKQPRKYQPLTSSKEPETSDKDASTSIGSPSSSSSAAKSQAAKKKPAGGKDGGADKKTADKDGSKKSQQDSKAKPASKDSSKTENSKPKSARPTTATSSRPKTAATRPGTTASSDSKSSEKEKSVPKKDVANKGQSSNKEDAAKKKPGVRASPELNESSSGKSISSNGSSKTSESSNAQRVQSGKKPPNTESKKANTESKKPESKPKGTDASVNNSKGKAHVKSSNANKYTKSTLGGIGDLTKGLSIASDDTEKEYLKQAQARINSPPVVAGKEKDKKTKDDVNNKSKSKTTGSSNRPITGSNDGKKDGPSSRPNTSSSDKKKEGSSSRPNTSSIEKKECSSARPTTASTSNAKKDTNIPPKAEHVPRPATAKVIASRPMTARPVPQRPATAKQAPLRPMTAFGEGRVRPSTGKKVPSGPVKKNSVVPENFPGKNNMKGSAKRNARDIAIISNQQDKINSLDSSQDSSTKSSSGSKSPDIKLIDMPHSSTNSLQSTSSSQASNASSDQPLLSSSQTAAKEAAKEEKKKKEKEEKEDDGKLFKSFKGFLGMGKKKEEPDDKKKLLEIESMSNNSQEGIELRSAAQLLAENGDSAVEPTKMKDEPQAGTPPDQKPPGPPQNSPEKEQTSEKPSPEKTPSEKAPDDDEPSDPEKANFVLHGKKVSYYIPDEFMGKDVCGDAPKESLQLDWVYGYRGNDCRCNMYVLKSGELIYFMGRIAILYNGQNHVQRHYMQHTADIKSLAVHSNQVIIATGQGAGSDGSYLQACVRVWKADTLETLHVLGDNDFEKTVISINFASTMPNYLVAVDGSDGHTMSIWDSESGKKIAVKKIATDVVCQVVFHPKRHQELISIGKEHMAYWSFRGEAIEEINKADYQTNMKAKYIICLAFKSNGDLVTGDSNGTVYVWANGGNTITQTIRHAHEGPVFSLLFHKNSLITGGRDGSIQSWKFSGPNGDQVGKLQIPSTEGGVRMLQVKDNTLYIGTTLNGIVTAELNQSGLLLTEAKLSDTPLTRGHYDNMYHVVAHPSPDKTSHFISAGFDGSLMCFDAKSHTTIWKYSMKGINIQCVDINPSGNLIALGTKDANVIILSISRSSQVVEECSIKLDKSPITCIKFSPDGDMIAIGSTNSIINIMRISNDGKNSQPIGKCKGHTGAITGFDWSVKKEEELGYILQSSSSSMEYSVWNTSTCKQVDDMKQVKNNKWTSHNCLTGYHVAGAWGSLTESPMISSADRSKEETLLVGGDSTGDIMVYRYPCAKPEASSNTVSAHSMKTSCVRLTGDNNYVLSMGGTDCTLMQWKIVKI